MNMPLISVLIVTWNRMGDVLETLESLQKEVYKNLEIIVVDNGSTDGTVEAIRRAYPDTKLVTLSKNVGASGGRNAGIKIAKGDIIFFLDSDAEIGEETLKKIAHKFQGELEVGIIACKIVNAHTKQLDRIASGWPFTSRNLADQDKSFLSYRFSEGGCAIRMEVLKKIGPFLDILFFGREGEELSLRAWDAGFKIIYWPEAIVYHRVSGHQSFTPGEKEYFDLHNALSIYLLRYPWWMFLWFVPVRIGVSLFRCIRRGYPLKGLHAILDVTRELPNLWRLRQPISNRTARFYLRLLRDHGALKWDLVSWLKYKT